MMMIDSGLLFGPPCTRLSIRIALLKPFRQG